MKLHGIGIGKATQMLTVTTRKEIRTATQPIYKRYRVGHLNLHGDRLRGKWPMDWMPVRAKSMMQYTRAFV